MPRKELSPVPARLRRMRGTTEHRWYARFYGNYISMTGIRRRFSFQVKITRRLSRNKKALRRVISRVVEGLKYDKYVPEHMQGEVFSSYGKLLYETPWRRVRKLLNYEAGVIYER